MLLIRYQIIRISEVTKITSQYLRSFTRPLFRKQFSPFRVLGFNIKAAANVNNEKIIMFGKSPGVYKMKVKSPCSDLRLLQFWCVQCNHPLWGIRVRLSRFQSRLCLFTAKQPWKSHLSSSWPQLVSLPSASLICSTYLFLYLCSCHFPPQCFLLLSYSTRPWFLKHQLKLRHSSWLPLVFIQSLNIY